MNKEEKEKLLQDWRDANNSGIGCNQNILENMKIPNKKMNKHKLKFWIKDYWWSIIFYSILILCVIDIINNLHTLQRWKWGYWSIDLIPPLIIVGLLHLANNIIWISRIDKRLRKLEGK